eukprot:TRINITY_DN10387_c0_g6_i1.p3 TRINITY_DN10387_c0_g6~~TRINITY_DN10387_c0_g6_i1.p3  ORF type:complete len:201 (-),score=46.58 TRINITY_DN10387_c0_g6_i1:1060-1662(-)
MKKLLEEARIKPKPQIDKHSEEIARTLVNFESRNCAQRTPSQRHTAALEDSQRECTFKPAILPTSKQMHAKNADEMSYMPMLQKEFKLKALKEKLVGAEARACTFQPEVKASRYSWLGSKLQLRDNIETYSARMELEKQKLENIAKMERRRREHKEIEECTHAPKINEFPQYILSRKSFESQRSLRSSARKQNDSYSKKH